MITRAKLYSFLKSDGTNENEVRMAVNRGTANKESPAGSTPRKSYSQTKMPALGRAILERKKTVAERGEG